MPALGKLTKGGKETCSDRGSCLTLLSSQCGNLPSFQDPLSNCPTASCNPGKILLTKTQVHSLKSMRRILGLGEALHTKQSRSITSEGGLSLLNNQRKCTDFPESSHSEDSVNAWPKTPPKQTSLSHAPSKLKVLCFCFSRQDWRNQ